MKKPRPFLRLSFLFFVGGMGAFSSCTPPNAMTSYYHDVTATHVPSDPEAHILEVAFVDVDGDGDLDVIAALEADENRLYLNDGSGKLTWKKGVFKAAKHDTEHVRAADFDGDGILDVVFVAEDDQTPEYYLGNGDATFRDVSDRLLGMSEGNGLDVGDVDGDGLPDIVVGNSGAEGQDFLWVNDPERPGYFIDRTAENLPQVNDATQSIKLADLNGDGFLDMVVGNEIPPNRLLFNDGKGVFTERAENLDLPEPLETREALVFDVDGDGDLDIVFANITSNGGVWDKNPRARILINDGQGRFSDETEQRMPEHKFSTYSAREVDFDHDGHLDLLLSALAVPGFGEEQLRAYRNDGKGYFTDVTAEVIPESVVGRNWNITIGDLDGDGIDDAFVGGWASQGRLLLGKAKK
ncbi:FG-GAP repeat domain-containing protein [Parapedobacter koreensis]|uniref:FG-GAP repeat domain-containing protein n=1 Tax=Parapedobacter koreensis TaxID=332977 RepID=UPI0015A59233|nr:VCBS repeat-containing protein [Parapedobacter koreensis]